VCRISRCRRWRSSSVNKCLRSRARRPPPTLLCSRDLGKRHAGWKRPSLGERHGTGPRPRLPETCRALPRECRLRRSLCEWRTDARKGRDKNATCERRNEWHRSCGSNTSGRAENLDMRTTTRVRRSVISCGRSGPLWKKPVCTRRRRRRRSERRVRKHRSWPAARGWHHSRIRTCGPPPRTCPRHDVREPVSIEVAGGDEHAAVEDWRVREKVPPAPTGPLPLNTLTCRTAAGPGPGDDVGVPVRR
jgi:hypothetical protein